MRLRALARAQTPRLAGLAGLAVIGVGLEALLRGR